jgi:hypothetical protein
MTLGDATLRVAIGLMTVVGLMGLAGPVAAETEEHACVVVAGTHASEPAQNRASASGTSPAGGLGECEIHTLGETAVLTEASSPDGCEVYVDLDRDTFVDERAEDGQVYRSGDSFVAFCETGETMAENAIVLDP